MFVLVPVCVLGYMCVYQGIVTCFSVSNCKLNFNIWSPNNEGSQFPKFHIPCNKEERFVLNSFFRKYNLYLKKKKPINLLKVLYHPVNFSMLHLHTHILMNLNTAENSISCVDFRMDFPLSIVKPNLSKRETVACIFWRPFCLILPCRNESSRKIIVI